MKEYTADDLLEAREKRVQLIAKLQKRYETPLLVLRVNYPGLKKSNAVTLSIIQDMSALICAISGDRVCFKSLHQGAEGPIFLAAIEEDVLVLKRAAMDLEEQHTLGRCLDIDVYDRSGKSLSRQELGYPSRKCYLCDDSAHHCVRARRHSEAKVIEYIEERFSDYKELIHRSSVGKAEKYNEYSKKEQHRRPSN